MTYDAHRTLVATLVREGKTYNDAIAMANTVRDTVTRYCATCSAAVNVPTESVEAWGLFFCADCKRPHGLGA